MGLGSTKQHSKAVEAITLSHVVNAVALHDADGSLSPKTFRQQRVDGSYDVIIAMFIWDLRRGD